MQTADQRESQLQTIDAQDEWVGQVVRNSIGNPYAEKKTEFFTNNPDAPIDGEEYDYDLMYEQNKMPDPDGEGFGFLPAEGYKSFFDREFTKPISRYSTKTKDNQFDNWEARVLAQSVRGAYMTVLGKPLAEIHTGISKFVDTAEGNEPRDYDALLERNLEQVPAPFKGSVTNPDVTVGAALEMLAAEAGKFALPMMAGKAAFGSSPAIKMAQGKSGFKRIMARMEDATSANMMAGEFLYAANPEAMQTLVKDTGEWLRDDLGMSGPFVDALIAADDTPLTKAIAGAAEGMVMFEALRTFAKTAVRLPAPVLRKAKTFIADSMREMDAIRKQNTEKAQ